MESLARRSAVDTEDVQAENQTNLVSVRSLEKRFGGVHALRGINLEVAARTVHGIVGPNGSGKSTLVKSIVGQVRPDKGEILLNGRSLSLQDPAQARAHGVAVVAQELALVPEMTVAENIALGAEPHTAGLIHTGTARRAAASAIRRIAEGISLDALGSELRPSQQRIVMIAAALFRNAQLVIMDEPTAGMELHEADEVLKVVRELTRRRVTVMYVSHRLDEILRVCDAVSLFRDGQCVTTLTRSEISKAVLTEAVTAGAGRAHSAPDDAVTISTRHARQPAAEVAESKVTCRRLVGRFLRGADFNVADGEIVGVVGTIESGAVELLEMLVGIARVEQGDIEIDRQSVTIDSPVKALRLGIGYLAAGRSHAAISDQPIRENISLSNTRRVARVVITPGAERRAVEPAADRMGVVRRFDDDISTLSGGNQQKVLLARLLFVDAQVVVLDDPTLGVDVGGRNELLAALRAFADGGKSVIIHSSEPAELVGTADRILLFHGGQVARELRDDQINEETLAVATAGLDAI